MNIVICTIKSWNIRMAEVFKLSAEGKHNTKIITEKKDLTYSTLEEFDPQYIFFPHWSSIIPKEIFEKWNCIVFHMTDLPFGRGGSPLQNLISRDIKDTKISAIKVNDTIDGGPVYIKENLNLSGTAEEIYMRASEIIFGKMIPYILDVHPEPVEQAGEIVTFKRRSPDQSELSSNMDLKQIYNYIRMLDGEGYPNAFINFGKYKLKFSRASFKGDRIIADVEIVEDDNE